MNAIFIYVISTNLYSITLFDISFKFDITVCEMSVINCIEIFVFSVGSKTLKLKNFTQRLNSNTPLCKVHAWCNIKNNSITHNPYL